MLSPSLPHLHFFFFILLRQHYHPSNALFISYGTFLPKLEAINNVLSSFRKQSTEKSWITEESLRTTEKTVTVMGPEGNPFFLTFNLTIVFLLICLLLLLQIPWFPTLKNKPKLVLRIFAHSHRKRLPFFLLRISFLVSFLLPFLFFSFFFSPYLFQESERSIESLSMQLLSMLLLDGPTAPMYKALIDPV
jgi:hypothetical protein